ILDTIARTSTALVVTGVARNAALGRASAGATVDALVRRCPVPLLAVKLRPNRPYQHVVVASDFSASSRAALFAVLEMFPAASVTLFHACHALYENFVEDKSALRDEEARHAEQRARAFLAEAGLAADRRVMIRCEYG